MSLCHDRIHPSFANGRSNSSDSVRNPSLRSPERSASQTRACVAESFFGTLQLELLDEHHWESRQQLALAVFEWVEAWYNPRRRHSYCKMLSPVDYEAAYAARTVETAA